MKKFLAIILIIVFVSAQYGRISNYYHCVIVNAVKTDFKLDCDCQKILIISPSAEKKDTAVPVHIHPVSLDEFFVGNEKNNLFNCSKELPVHNSYYNRQYSYTAFSTCFIPPEC